MLCGWGRDGGVVSSCMERGGMGSGVMVSKHSLMASMYTLMASMYTLWHQRTH